MPNWIPRDIMSDILQAVEAEDNSTQVFYITSGGGEGKTILLRQVGMKLGSVDGMASSERWSGILDLYHSDVNTNSGLETHLSEALQTKRNEFGPYHNERDIFTARREAGLLGPELEEERTRVAEVFAECMNAVTEERRVVVAVDTTERIQYERDKVQEHCHLEAETTTVRAWLLDQLVHWKNCVVLLVGRPEGDPYLGQALQEKLEKEPAVQYNSMTLGGFTESEARAYFAQKAKQVPEVNEVDPDFLHLLWEVTKGSPIRLDLAIEVIQRGLGFDKFQEKVEQAPRQAARDEIDRLLIESVMNDPDDSLRQILRYLAVARKGLDAELLHYLAGEWDIDRCQQLLDTVAERGFIKKRPGDERLFLHDEMYQLCDKNLFQAPAVQSLSERIAAWYDEQIETAKNEGCKDRQQDLEIDSLIYRLRADPREGYHWYVRQAESAIRSVQAGLDMQLRSEVLAFLGSKSPIDANLLSNTSGLAEEFNCDSAAHWVKRLMMQGKNEKAVKVGEQACIAFCPPDDPKFKLARAELEVHKAESMIYTGRAQEAVALLYEIIADIENGRKPEELAPQKADSYEGWRRNLVLGRGHNDIGYAHWMLLGHYEAALEEFRSALPYFRASELEEELANTQDNMGRVYGLRRHPTRAETLVDEGLRIRRDLGREYRVGLSLNSRAIVHLEFSQPRNALPLSEQALDIFEGLGARRGIGLALITLGRSLRKMGGLWREGTMPHKDCETYFRRGTGVLQQAVDIFEEEVDEPVRMVEALNELGCIYRDWSRLARASGKSSLSRTTAVEAVKYLEQCIERAEKLQIPVQYVDTCEDLAHAFYWRGHFDNAHRWLRRAYENVPEEYKFAEGGRPEIPTEECIEAFWQQMGKIELLWGDVVWDEGTGNGSQPASRRVLGEAARHYLLSSIYFEHYSGRDVGLQIAFRHVYVRFKYAALDDLGYLQQDALPTVAEQYSIDATRFLSFLRDTLGLSSKT